MPGRRGVDNQAGGAGPGPSLGVEIRARRRGLGLTLQALAARVGCARSYLSLIENDRQSGTPSEGLLRKLEDALSLPEGRLLSLARWREAHPTVRRAVTEMAERDRAARRLFELLKSVAGAGPGRLDQLHRSGELQRAIERLDGLGAGRTANTSTTHAGVGTRTVGAGVGVGASIGGAAAGEHGARAEGGAGVAAPGASAAGASSSSAGGAGGAGGLLGADELTRWLPVEVPLINSVAAGYPTEFTDLGYPARVADEYVRVPEVRDPDAFAARVVGDSMEPVYREGDIVVFSPAKPVGGGWDAQRIGGVPGGVGAAGAGNVVGAGAEDVGVDCFVRLERDHESTFKRVFFERGPEGEALIRLQPLNAKYPPRVVRREDVAGLYAAVSVTRKVGRE